MPDLREQEAAMSEGIVGKAHAYACDSPACGQFQCVEARANRSIVYTHGDNYGVQIEKLAAKVLELTQQLSQEHELYLAAQKELERERMRLAAVGVAALEGATWNGCHEDYGSASLNDVLKLVKHAAALAAQVEKMKDALKKSSTKICIICAMCPGPEPRMANGFSGWVHLRVGEKDGLIVDDPAMACSAGFIWDAFDPIPAASQEKP